jgi:hypothetical protein
MDSTPKYRVLSSMGPTSNILCNGIREIGESESNFTSSTHPEETNWICDKNATLFHQKRNFLTKNNNVNKRIYFYHCTNLLFSVHASNSSAPIKSFIAGITSFFLVGWDLRHQVLRPLLAYCTAPNDR